MDKEQDVQNMLDKETEKIETKNNKIQEINQEKGVLKEEKKSNIQEEKETEKKCNIKKKNKILIVILILLLFIVILAMSTIFAIINMGNNNIYKGIKIQDIDISNLSKSEANELIQSRVNDAIEQNIILKYKDYETTINAEEIEASFNIEEVINEAYNTGRKDNIFINNYEILTAALFGKNIDIRLEFNQEILKNIIDNTSKELPEAMIENSYSINGEELIITKGKRGVVLDKKNTIQKIESNILSLLVDNQEKTIDVATNISEPGNIDIEKIYSEIYRKAQDAYITKEPFEIHPHIDGIDFNITMEEAKQILVQEKDEYKIPLKITTPSITTKKLGAEAFPHTLSKFTTSYSGGTQNRATNIAIAARTINGIVLLPGETFSYNGVLGDTTPNKGYKIGTAYAGGKIVEAYGGGICQVSSTLYNSVLLANLEIVLRYNHTYPVGYVKPGRDATVSYGGKDFKFKNSRNYPVKIVASAKNGVLTVQILGVKEETEYDIELKSTVTQTTHYSVTYQNNSSLEKGKQKVIQNGMNGYKSVTYKIVKDKSGQIVSNTLLSSDTYKAMNKIVEVGTKETTKSSTTTNNTTNDNSNNNTNINNALTTNTNTTANVVL